MMSNLDVAQILVEELTRLGVTQFVISPGSRSTPLTVAVARHHEAKTAVHFDERGAAFYALGHARATGIPAVLVCTSGTAVANYFPAVIEASMDNIPLIVLSADRPPELIDVGANQAIFQQHIYGVYPRLTLNLSPSDSATSGSDILNSIDALFDASTGNRPGPVHLNCQFREPLLPDNPQSIEHTTEERDWRQGDARFTEQPIKTFPHQKDIVKSIAKHFRESNRGLIIVGRSVDKKYNTDILELAETFNTPILPDVQSQLRFSEHDQIINHFDLALLSDDLQQSKPDFIVHFGGAYTSKRLLNYVNDSAIYYISVKETPERIDPNDQVSIEIITNIGAFCQSFNAPKIRLNHQWLHTWQRLGKKTAGALSQLLNNQSQLSEPATSYQLSKLIPNNHSLMLANSMSIREMEMFASPGYFQGEIFANRGSSGIDGLLATSAGYAAGSGAAVTVLIGDLAFLHDLNSLQLIKISEQPIIIIVINNDGGGIFNFLPIKSEADIFEPFFGTPHGLTLEHAASMFDLLYSNPADMDEFQTIYSSAANRGESILIELITDRGENYRFHQRIFENIRESS